MSNVFVSFGMHGYERLQQVAEEDALQIGFDHTFGIDLLHLIQCGFYKKHRLKFDRLQNAGCVWKPYIIREVLLYTSPGDFIYYSDVTDKLHKGIVEYTRNQATKYGVSLVASNFINKEWTKWDCFRLMGCEEDKYLNTNQLDAGQIGLFNCDDSKRFINTWLHFCEDDDILLDHTLTEERFNLQRHSRDQSILTNLAVRLNIPATPINTFIKYYTPNFRSP